MGRIGTAQQKNRLKIALIPVLAVVLVVVLRGQFTGEGEAPTVELKTDVSTASAAIAKPQAAGEAPVAVASEKRREVKAWPQIEREEILRHDPFVFAPELIVQRAAVGEAESEDDRRSREEQRRQRQAERQQVLAKLQQDGVAMIVRGAEGFRAQVGGRIVKEGDVIEGFRVKKIRPDGIELEEDSIQ